MALSLGNSGGSTFGGSGFASLGVSSGNAQTQTGPDLDEIQTEGLGFHALAGESRVQLLPSAWPADALPSPTSSLLAVASKKGLLAAAGPSSVIIASTESVRQAFGGDGGDVKPYSPQLSLDPGTRISQVAFSSDESVLVISAEQGGGLAIYSTDDLMQGNQQAAFQLPTNQISVRALVPNPAAEHAELLAVVTTQGQLLMANLKERKFVSGVNGEVLKEGVSCVSWSNKGKQLVAGLGDGTASQMKPDGEIWKELPRPSNIGGDQHVSAISWLENDLFIVAHTPTNDDSSGVAPTTTYHLITREKDSGRCIFQKLPEVCSPYGFNRSPPFQFIQRLSDFPPDIQDIVIVASTASSELGLFTRSRKALAPENDPSRFTNVFTTTGMADDSRRAAMPMSEDMTSETSPIGMALDLSSKSNVHRPLQGEEMEESQGPLPGLMVLNHLGVLSAWWIVYKESIRSGTLYPGLAMYAGQQQTPSRSQPQTLATTSAFSQPVSSQSSFGSPTVNSTFDAPGKAATPTFSNTGTLGGSAPTFVSASSMGASKPTFGSPSALGGGAPLTFGAASGLGNRSSPWSSNASQTTGGITFGQPSFGSAGGLGQKPSLWGASSTGTGTTFGQTSSLGGQASVFGQPSSFGGQSSAFAASTPRSTFGSAATPVAGSGAGFASFANGGGFAAAAKVGGGSFLQQSTPNKSLGSEMDTGSSFGAPPGKEDLPASGSSGFGSVPFQLGSAWKNEIAGKDQTPKSASQNAGGNLFGGDFGKALGEASTQATAPQSKEADMGDISDLEKPKEADKDETPERPKESARETTTPADTPAPSKVFSVPPADSGLFGTQAQSQDTPATEVQKSAPATSIFGAPLSKPEDIATDSAPIIKKEPVDEDSSYLSASKTPGQSPLPPVSTSKASYTAGTSSAASSASDSKQSADEAPSPPDSSKPSGKPETEAAADKAPLPAAEVAPLPPDFMRPKRKDQPPQTPTDAPPSFLSPKPRADEPEESPGEATALPDDNESLGDEDSGVDVAKEITESSSPKITPESSFGAKQDASPIDGPFTEIAQPRPQPVQKSLFGEAGKGKMPVFPPPSKLQESPRSPSPVRSLIPSEMLRPDNQRSVSAPGVPAGRGLRRSMIQAVKPDKSFEERKREEQERRAREKERQRQEEEQSLSDQEDEFIRERLAAPLEPKLELEAFVAHTDYVGESAKPGIPGQIERLYRDINSMIDTLGNNSRTLQEFIQGQYVHVNENGRDKEDLSIPRKWTLVEIEDLSTLETSLSHELESGRLRSVDDKIADIQALQRDIAKLRARQNDLKRTVDSHTDPDNLDAQRTMPLSAEQSIQRHDLRRAFASFQASLCRTEEAISVLRAKLASTSASAPSKRRSPQKQKHKVPTVEAVENTIRKMTAMAERKSGDVDVLETRLRRLGLGARARSPEPRGSPAGAMALLSLGDGAGGETGASPARYSSRASSPADFMTPPTSARKSLRGSVMVDGSASMGASAARHANGNGFRTPLGNSIASSSYASYAGGSPGKSGGRRRPARLGEMEEGEVRAHAERMAKRREARGAIRAALVERGEARVRPLGA